MKNRKAYPCKLGTQPAVVFIFRNVKPAIGKHIKVRDTSHGSKWERVLVLRVNPDGYFFADR